MIKRKKKPCEGCGQEMFIYANKRCKRCYTIALASGNKPGRRIKPISDKGMITINLDRELYLELWKERKHECEECGRDLGKIPKTYYFSHILSKGAHPEHRRNKENFNILCWTCHQKWEFGNRSQMKIYPKNVLIGEKLGGMI